MTFQDGLSREILTTAIEEAVSITTRNMKKWDTKIALDADAGVYNVRNPGDWTGTRFWSCGFGPGIYWLCYIYTGNKEFRDTALKIAEQFDKIDSGRNQSQGVLFMPVCAPAYKFCGSEKAKQILINGADILMGQFDEKGSYFKAYEEIENFSVDCIVNISLLHWASQNTGDPRYYEAAIRHIQTELNTIIRPDGSTYHLVWIYPDGRFQGGDTNQGLSKNSCWSRGQAWAMYGFSLHYRYTQDTEYLKAFKRLSKYFFDNLPDDGIPFWDLKIMSDTEPRDTSAAAIAICGVLEMARQLPCDSEVQVYKEKARGMMLSLIKNYSVAYDNYIDAFILGGCENKSKGWYDESLIFGDYFYMEALIRLLTDYDTYWQ